MALHVQAGLLTALLLGVAGAASAACTGCASEPGPAPVTGVRSEPVRSEAAFAGPAPAAVHAAQGRAAQDDIQISGTGVLGTLADDEIRAPIEQHWSEIQGCKTGGRAPWYVGGKVDLHFRISLEGQVKKLNIEDSSLGNWSIERCLLGIGRALHFARPRGGEAEFSYPIEFPVRAPVAEWGPERIETDLAKHEKDIEQCDRAGTRHPYTLTLYLGAGGKVTSAGIAFPDEIDEAYVDCVIAKAQSWRLTDPLGVVARARYPFGTGR